MIICADDYGMADDVNQAILELCALKHLSAVSCMAAIGRCESDAFKPLLEHQADVDIGLHLCFADETLPPLENGLQPLPAFGIFFVKQFWVKSARNKSGCKFQPSMNFS
jgi:predicted glycoside hydrolase/deacetylase ChbG (UPF0249 family)